MDRTLTRTLIGLTVTAMTIGVCYSFLDRPLAEAAHTLKDTAWHTTAKQLSLAASSHFTQMLLVTGFLYAALDAINNGINRRVKNIFYLCICVSTAMVIGDVLKDLLGRARPPLFFEKGIYGFFPFTGGHLYSSFPSGHTIRAFSSMVALGFIMPRLRYPALACAILIGIARVFALKHYPSDVLFGAFIGTTAAIWGWRILYPYGQREN
ncbi:MAG: phosphatase PAP2 family protein [Pseudodesulfovibrio sp.]